MPKLEDIPDPKTPVWEENPNYDPEEEKKAIEEIDEFLNPKKKKKTKEKEEFPDLKIEDMTDEEFEEKREELTKEVERREKILREREI